MGGCCNDCASDSVSTAPSVDTKQVEMVTETACCEGSSCGCNDTCIDQLARVICADDDTHSHGQGQEIAKTSNDVDSSCDSIPQGRATPSGCSCCAGEETQTEDAKDDSASLSTGASGNGNQYTGIRQRKVTKTSSPTPVCPKEACGEHRTIARSQYQTLSAFGCVCKALLARGMKSCCSPNGSSGKAKAKDVSRHNSSKQSIRLIVPGRASIESSRPASVHSCCGKSDCGRRASSIRSVSHSGRLDIQSHKSKSRVSVDSCCQDSCCAGGSSSSKESAKDGKSEQVAIDLLEKGMSAYSEHAILAIKGMTCVGCESKLKRTLQGIPTISNPKASLVLCRAEFDFDGNANDVESLVQLIEKRSGFTAQVINAGFTRDLLLTVPRHLQDKFLSAARLLGIQDVIRSDKDTFLITYDPHLIGARKILDVYSPFSPLLAPEPPDPAIIAGAKHIRSLSIRAALSAALTIPVLVITWAPLPPHPRPYSIACLVLATIVQTAITGPFYVNSFKSLVFSRLIETELLIVLSTTAAYVYSVVAFAFDMLRRPLATGQFFETSTLLVTLIMIGQVISGVARQRAIEAISIRSLQERTALVVFPDDTEHVLDVRLLQYGDTFKVLPDSGIITDGEVVSGTSTVDESMMTGESRPVEKGPGSSVIAGTVNGPSTLVIKVARLPGENTISDIAQMVDEARFSRAEVQEVVDLISGWFVPAVLVLAIITFAVWMAVGVAVRKESHGEAGVAALTYAIAVLAISCPCAIGLAVPMVILIAGGVGAKQGLVFKAATTIEQARKVTHVVLDKTGTVTEGKLCVVWRFVDEDAGIDVRSAIGELVGSSRHPVARAVKADVVVTVPGQALVQDVEMVTGKGVQGRLLGQVFRGGSAEWVGVEDHACVRPFITEGLTTFCVVHGTRLVAAFGLCDTVRPEAHAVMECLTARKIRVSMLSGDHPGAVFAVATSLGIPVERVRAGCLPGDKQRYIKELAAEGEIVLFCGDGTNDAVALAEAAIGVHLQTGEGAGVAASTAADVVLTHPSLGGIVTLLELSDAVGRRIMVNFVWSFVYNLVAILLAAGAFVNARIPPAYAGLGEIVSVVPVVLVAVHLKWFKASV